VRVLFVTLYPDCAASPRYRVGKYVPGPRAAAQATVESWYSLRYAAPLFRQTLEAVV